MNRTASIKKKEREKESHKKQKEKLWETHS
jgi:hypothetical protein